MLWCRGVYGPPSGRCGQFDNPATSGLVTSALGMAIENRQPHRGTVIHSDQGTQFASWAFTQRAHTHTCKGPLAGGGSDPASNWPLCLGSDLSACFPAWGHPLTRGADVT